MKLLHTLLLIIIADVFRLSVGRLLKKAQIRSRQDPFDSLLARYTQPSVSSLQPTNQTSTAQDNNLALSDLLSSGGWPAQEMWDQAFSNALSGASEDPCDAPLLGRARLSPYGFGAHLNQFANEVALAMYAGKPIALCAPASVRDSWTRYFQDPGFSRCSTCDWGSGPRRYSQMGFDVSNGHDHDQVAAIKHFLYRKLFTLQTDSQMQVDTSLQSIGLSDTSYVGVHVRRGDKFQEVPPVPMANYVQAIVQMCASVGSNTIFVASDDDSVYGLLQSQLGSSYKVVEQPRLPPTDYQFRGEASRALSPEYGVEDGEKSVLVDVVALAHAAGFVGTASSNIGRLVYFLREPGSPATSLDEGGNDGFVTLKG